MPGKNGISGYSHWATFIDGFSDAEWDDYVASLERAAALGLEGYVLITLVHGTQRPTALQRQALAEMSKAYAAVMKTVKAHAFIGDSAITRGALTAINWVVKKPFPEKIFKRPEDGFAWLTLVAPHFDRETAWRDMIAQTPQIRERTW